MIFHKVIINTYANEVNAQNDLLVVSINVWYQISEFSAMCNRILKWYIPAMLIWRTYRIWLGAVQLLVSEGYPIKLLQAGYVPLSCAKRPGLITIYIAHVEFCQWLL
jgi:hypothetical protein